MVQEESRLSRKMKHKRIPQRGLGVAQLEKIRLEEQHDRISSVFLPLPHQSCSISFVTPSIPTDLSSSSSFSKSPSSIPFSNFDLFIPSPPPPPPPPSLGTNSIYGYPPEGSGENGVSGYSSTNKTSYDLAVEIPKFDYRFNRTWDSWKTESGEQQSPSPLGNISTLSSSSSGLNFQIELPSIQRNYSNYSKPPMCIEEDKMVGMKRRWPFSLDYPPESSFNYKVPQLLPPICRLEEWSLCTNGDSRFNLETECAYFSEDASNIPSINDSEPNSKRSSKEEERKYENFLTLGPLPSRSYSTNSESKQPFLFPFPVLPHQEFPEFNMLPDFTVYNGDPFLGSKEIVQQNQQNLCSVFQSKQIDRSTPKLNNQRSKTREGMDLSLRL